MLKRNTLAHTALTTAAAAMCLTTMLAPAIAAAQTSGSVDVPVPLRPADSSAPPPSAPSQAPNGAPAYGQGGSTANNGYDRQQYARAQAQWQHDNCVQQKSGSTVAGVVVGGVLGALIGSGLGGRGSRSEAAAIGGVSGAALGGVVGANSGSPCPQGYAVAQGYYQQPPAPPPAAYGYYGPPSGYYAYGGPVVYDAPPYGYYGPAYSFWYGGRWGGRGYWRGR